MDQYQNEISRAAELLKNTRNAVAFCGSGVSEESGIATFRDPGGIWDRINPMEVGTLEGIISVLTKNPGRILPVFMDLLEVFEKADFNPGHRALAEFEKMGILKKIITQNIDNLQQEAGSVAVIEVHGNMFRLACVSCGRKVVVDRKPFVASLKSRMAAITAFTLPAVMELAPRCGSCGSLMRPDVVMFGEAVQELPHAFAAARGCDMLLVLGTSGVVYPAAEIPFEAKKRFADIIVINPNENAFSDITDIYIPMKTGEALPAILNAMKKSM
ncbi:MAG TPA: Sir2 family NAD-dependent protein deacetylase [Spirochaetota bacterium]|nr:Sir2 family NAD-dependent protein deacetylase [Spirochaetota bacterium]